MTFYFFKRFIFTFILGFFACALVRKHLFNNYKKKSSATRELYLCIFAGFSFAVISQLLTPNFLMENAGISMGIENSDFIGNYKNRWGTKWGINLVPFKTISRYLRFVKGTNAWYNLLGNIILFTPFGFALPFFWKRFSKFKRVFITIFIFSFAIEFIQYFIGRSVDIDDLILNTLGGVLGYYLYKKFVPRKKRAIMAR